MMSSQQTTIPQGTLIPAVLETAFNSTGSGFTRALGEIGEHIDHLVLFSGDGDFRSVVEAVQRRGRKVSVVSTLSTQPPMIADELRRQADNFIDLLSLQPRVGRDPAERAARAAERAQAHSGFDEDFDN